MAETQPAEPPLLRRENGEPAFQFVHETLGDGPAVVAHVEELAGNQGVVGSMRKLLRTNTPSL